VEASLTIFVDGVLVSLSLPQEALSCRYRGFGGVDEGVACFPLPSSLLPLLLLLLVLSLMLLSLNCCGAGVDLPLLLGSNFVTGVFILP